MGEPPPARNRGHCRQPHHPSARSSLPPPRLAPVCLSPVRAVACGAAVDVLQVGPGIVQFVFNNGVIGIETVTPVERLLQRVTHHFYASPWVPSLVAKGVFRGMITQYERDAFCFNQKRFLSAPLLTKEDVLISRYRYALAHTHASVHARTHTRPIMRTLSRCYSCPSSR